MKVKERKIEEDNSYMFKRLASHHPPIYNSTPDPKAFEDWIQVWRSCSMLFNAPRSGICSTLRIRPTYGGPLCERSSTSMGSTRRGSRS